jgi:hypothetical protein
MQKLAAAAETRRREPPFAAVRYRVAQKTCQALGAAGIEV